MSYVILVQTQQCLDEFRTRRNCLQVQKGDKHECENGSDIVNVEYIHVNFTVLKLINGLKM